MISEYRKKQAKEEREITIKILTSLIVTWIVFPIIGAISANYLLVTFFEKSIPWWKELILGLFFGKFLLWGAILTWALKSSGIF